MSRGDLDDHDDGGCAPIIVADGGVQCSECGEVFAREEARMATFDGDEALYQCPSCGGWSAGPPPG